MCEGGREGRYRKYTLENVDFDKLIIVRFFGVYIYAAIYSVFEMVQKAFNNWIIFVKFSTS
jgi:hypothetical protein